MTVTNVGDQTQPFMANFQKLKDGGNIFDPSADAQTHLGGLAENIDPGDQFQATVAYDVPVGATPQSIELHGWPVSGTTSSSAGQITDAAAPRPRSHDAADNTRLLGGPTPGTFCACFRSTKNN